MAQFWDRHGNAFLAQKENRIACAFIVTFLFYSSMDRDKRKFVISILPDTSLSTLF